ncbi:MAG: hypothetical protein CM15mP51_21810 [Porticoccaceae bacterium]|nr:MAG: hypothetical protein CM15mP51_21810 [Porticoccaceae bacterium]
MEWWSANADVVAERACWFDDRFVFGEDGSFQNVLGETTWIEAWQGGSDACGAPVAPHDGSASATFSYDEASATLTFDGQRSSFRPSKGCKWGRIIVAEFSA